MIPFHLKLFSTKQVFKGNTKKINLLYAENIYHNSFQSSKRRKKMRSHMIAHLSTSPQHLLSSRMKYIKINPLKILTLQCSLIIKTTT